MLYSDKYMPFNYYQTTLVKSEFVALCTGVRRNLFFSFTKKKGFAKRIFLSAGMAIGRKFKLLIAFKNSYFAIKRKN